MTITHCGTCGREFKPYESLQGWTPCRCSGHRDAYCRPDVNGGCGAETYEPPMREETCGGLRQGY